VDGFGGEILARAGFPCQHYGGGGARRHARQQSLDPLPRRRRPDDRPKLELFFMTARRVRTSRFQLAGFKRLPNQQGYVIEMKAC
jgi:hypothetical protein